MVPLQHIGPALATSLAAIFNVAWLAVVLIRRGHLQIDAQLRQRSIRVMGAAAAMGLVLVVTQHLLFGTDHSASRLLALTALVSIGLVVYAVAALFSGAADLSELRRLLNRRRIRTVR